MVSFPILLILSRELLVTGIRLVAAGKGKTLAAEKIGKLKTVIQLTCLSLSLAKVSVESDFHTLISSKTFDLLVSTLDISMISSLLLATLITVVSGVLYMKKYWRLFTE